MTLRGLIQKLLAVEASMDSEVGYYGDHEWFTVDFVEAKLVETGMCSCGHPAVSHRYSVTLKTGLGETTGCVSCGCKKYLSGTKEVVVLT